MVNTATSIHGIAIIEDDDVFRRSLVEMFATDKNYFVAGDFSNVTDFLERLPSLDADIYWLDINLPDGTGIELVKEIRKRNPEALCLMCTLHNDDQHVFDALEAGANGYILKNTPAAKMLECIGDLLAGGAPMSPYIATKVIRSFHKTTGIEFEALTERENEVLEGLSKGLLYKEIARHYEISRETVKKHIGNIYRKLHVQNRTEAVLRYFGK